jgi:hypothetical protein
MLGCGAIGAALEILADARTIRLNRDPRQALSAGHHTMVRISIPHYGTTEQVDVPRVSRKNSVSSSSHAHARSSFQLLLALR